MPDADYSVTGTATLDDTFTGTDISQGEDCNPFRYNTTSVSIVTDYRRITGLGTGRNLKFVSVGIFR
jgi:hypothetical protein